MLAEVKKYADKKDMKGLRYIFVDCLDVDPTFEKYRADYEYCKGMEGFFESHSELHGIVIDQSKWNLQYWEQLKIDLIKNFSEKRFEHMIKVAKIVYASKIERLLSERESKSSEVKVYEQLNEQVKSIPTTGASKKMIKEEQEKQLASRRKALEAENQRVEAEQREQRARIEAKQNENLTGKVVSSDIDSSKKGMGIVFVIVAVIVLGAVIIILR